MKFLPERLESVRKKLNINKAEAARRINVTAMTYGRYEKGEREPSFQTVSHMAVTFNTTTDYLYGLSNNAESEILIVSKGEEPELFEFVKAYKEDNQGFKRLFAYINSLTKK